MNTNIAIPEYAKVKVYWDDRTENYSREAKLKVRNYFSTKYGVSKSNINVIYRPIKVGKNGEVIKISGAGIDNILDRNYQVQLMKEWFKREEKTIDFNRILDLDKKVNASLESEVEVANNRSWELKWLFVDNFLCFGEKNFVSFGNLNGLNIVNSEPPNQGGKTTFSVDAIKFLLFGKTTKTEKNEQIFNTYTEKNELTVRGMLMIDGEEMIIERILTRKPKRSGGYTVVNKVHYYKLLPDGEEELLDEEDAKKTSEVIKKNIGTEKDFDITILATERNLDDLIEAKPTESGRLLTRFIGLEVIENKDAIAKKMNSDFNKSKKGNLYDITTLLSDNTEAETFLTRYREMLADYKVNLSEHEAHIERLENEKERLLNSKLKVDVEITQLNPETIQSDIDRITAEGLEFKNRIVEFEDKIKSILGVEFDEFEYDKLEKDNRTLTIQIGGLENDVSQIGKVIEDLESGEICQTCNRALDDVDNSELIKNNKTKQGEALLKITLKSAKLLEINESMQEIKLNRDIVDRRNRLELEKDKAEVEIGALRNKIVAKNADLKKYKTNESAIKTNISIDADISAVKTDLIVHNKLKDDTKQNIYSTETEITTNETLIETNLKMIETLKREEEIEKVFKVYLEMIGKKGISKLVLRSVLPIINSELARLLDGVCDFEIELEMNDKNEVDFKIIKSDVSKLLKSGSGLERTISSLALRCVLGKISHLPTPNFITFDEVLGKVAVTNIEKIRPMFEKITDMFDIVFFITHNDLVKDWGDKLITVKKVNDVSTIKV